MSQGTLLTTADLASRLGMHAVSIARWRVEGKGPPYFKSGEGKKARVFYRLKDVREWEKQNNFVKRSTI